MEWLDRLKNVMNYIEENIRNDLDIKKIASMANSSEFHFQRVFCILTGYTIKDYIRRRRLSLAASELVFTDKGILEIAIDYGYETQASFTKAFSRLHGLTPGAVRQGNQVLKAFPPISFHLSINGGVTMDYEIKELPAFQVVGKMIAASSENGDNFTEIPKFWQKVMGDGSFDAIMKLADENGLTGGAPMGICIDFTDDTSRFDYMVACESTIKKAPEGMVIKDIPAHQWAVFKTQGPLPDSIQQLWNRIFSEWFPATQYNHAKGPELEIYPPSPNEDPKNPFSEVWIPIEK